MKKIFFAVIMLFTALLMNAQTFSRLSVGLGGGISMAPTNVIVKYTPRPMGTFDLGYTFLGAVNPNVNLGFRSGLNVVYAQNDLHAVFAESFTNTDALGIQYDYRINGNVFYQQQQVNLEVPVMFAIETKGFYLNLGMKLQMPVWNTYNQTIKDCEIACYLPSTQELRVNRSSTGALTAEQRKTTGKASLPNLFCALSLEIGHVWTVNESNNLGFDLFFDYAPTGFYNNSLINRSNPLIQVENSADETANVTVRPLTECNNFNFRQFNMGVKFVYAFDIDHNSVRRPKM